MGFFLRSSMGSYPGSGYAFCKATILQGFFNEAVGVQRVGFRGLWGLIGASFREDLAIRLKSSRVSLILKRSHGVCVQSDGPIFQVRRGA